MTSTNLKKKKKLDCKFRLYICFIAIHTKHKPLCLKNTLIYFLRLSIQLE